MVKHTENILLQNQESFKAESRYIASVNQDLQILVKWWSQDDLWFFSWQEDLYGENVAKSFSHNVLKQVTFATYNVWLK